MKKFSLFGFLILFGVVLALLTCLLIYAFEAGVFTRWERVGQIPDTTARLINGDPYTALLQTTNEQVFTCRSGGTGDCWEAGERDLYSTGTASCSDDLPAFWPVMNVPENIVSCIYSDGGYAEMGFKVVYAMDSSGTLWRWSDTSSAYGILVYPVIVLMSGVLGVLLGTIVWSLRRLALRKRLPEGEPLFTRGQVVLLAVPWVIVGGLVVLWLLSYFI